MRRYGFSRYRFSRKSTAGSSEEMSEGEDVVQNSATTMEEEETSNRSGEKASRRRLVRSFYNGELVARKRGGKAPRTKLDGPSPAIKKTEIIKSQSIPRRTRRQNARGQELKMNTTVDGDSLAELAKEAESKRGFVDWSLVYRLANRDSRRKQDQEQC